MASGFRLGLLKWGDGRDILSHWDAEHGSDTHIVLTENGAYEKVWQPDGDDFIEVMTPITDLPQYLRQLLRRLESAEKSNQR